LQEKNLIYAFLADNIKYISRANRKNWVIDAGKYGHLKPPILTAVTGFMETKENAIL
jgi:hypothetical protein